MSPARPGSRRNSSSGFKPYTRGVTPIMVPSTPDGIQDMKPTGHNERPGFPTYAQYKQVENTYIQSLTPRRQGKALISQALFDRIWDVLHQPDAPGETAQFRFWARKMFTLSKTHRVTLGGTDNSDDAPQEVLLHDNLLVAIQEQLYDLLCYCHGSTGHGGRDKTCALIRKHYTWVPKDLVSNFIKACPTCIMKKCGNIDSAALASQMAEPRAEEANLSPFRDFFPSYGPETTAPSPTPSSPAPGIPWPTMGGPRDHPMSPLLDNDPLEAAYREAILRARGMKPTLAGVGSPNYRGLQSVPMTREVSLYKGLPNGWQYRYNDYATAHAEFMKMKDLSVVEDSHLPLAQRPRVPSILPLFGPDHFSDAGFGNNSDLGESSNLMPSLEPISGSEHQQSDCEVSMQYMLMSQQQQQVKGEIFLHQIDPLLMQLSTSAGSHDKSDGPHPQMAEDLFSGNLAASASLPSSSSIKRAAAPPRLNLDFPSEKTLQALLAYREKAGDTPDSPLMAWQPGNPSPTSSESSCSSQLSAFPTSATTNPTPTSSALPTPVDECDQGANSDERSGFMANVVKGKNKVEPEVEPTEAELSESIQVACGI
ncbi:unnamed protein product [Cyclocybe aegerita]|uniref:Integrase zinc-binding domain-containing protein n=1 Tax=Cyclocybe aegerita TaxID=1973307 RepID=A0A8S0XPR5_CYCAE|nr:unnamed protein product [Cyclocybe aegerita]